MMNYSGKIQENKNNSRTNSNSSSKNINKSLAKFTDNRPETVVQRKLIEMTSFNSDATALVIPNSSNERNHVIQGMWQPGEELNQDEATSSGYTTGAGAWTEEIYDDDETEVKGKLDAFGKSYSFKGTHAETKLIDALSDDVDSLDGDAIHLVVWISKSPCTSTSRQGFPKTNSSGMGCTERLANLANNGLGGKTFIITIIAHHLYQPSVKGGKNASRAALQYLESLTNVNGVSLEQGDFKKFT